MKKRSLLIMLLGLLLTFGIYPLYWYCSVQNQFKKQTGLGFGGFGHLIVSIFTLGIYAVYWHYAAGVRIKKLGGKNNGVLFLVLTLFGLGFIPYFLIQNEINSL